MTLHPEMAAALDALRDVGPMEQMPLAELRASVVPLPADKRTPVESVEDQAIDGDLKVRIYQPVERRCDGLIVFFHGGGFVIGSIETHDHVARDLCAAAACATISVDYRLAPEHRFPAAPDDCLRAARWAGAAAARLGASPSRIVLAGDSAGGTLAAVTALRLRDEGDTSVCGQVLGYPVTDYHTPPTRSYIENATGYSLTRDSMIRFWREYVADESQARHPYASPLQAADLSRLPPALIMTAEYDPLRDEGEAYAAKLARDGVQVELIRYPGLIHGFLRMAAVSGQARAAFVRIGEWVREHCGA